MQTALLANRWFMRDLGEWNGPTWSLSVEILAYAIFPVLALVVARARSQAACLSAGVGFLIALIVFQLGMHNVADNMNGRISIVRAMTCFPAGVALYRVGAFTPSDRSGERWGASLALASALALLVILLVPRAGVLAPLCFAGIIMGVRFGKGIINTLLCSRTAIFLGEISFALYLVHLVPLNLLLWNVERYQVSPARAFMALASYLMLIILISFVLHEWVELPVQRHGRRLVARLFEQPVPPSALEQLEPGLMPPPAGGSL